MGIVEDIVARLQVLKTNRSNWERIWNDIATFCMPDHARFQLSSTTSAYNYDSLAQEPSSVARGRARFDDTALRALDRLASGIESLVTPQSDKWHGLGVTDPLAPEETDEEAEYFETYRDYMFKIRYNPDSGFIGAHQKALRSCIAMGTGVTFVEECMGPAADRTPILWTYIPLSQAYIDVNSQGRPDTLYREFSLTARQMVQKFGEDSVHENVKQASKISTQTDRRYTVIHAVQPRGEVGSDAATNRAASFASYYVDRDNNFLIGDSGYFEFPFDVYYWQPVEDMAYAQSPVMLAMADIKGLNAVRKSALTGFQQFFKPPMAIAHDGLMNRPNLNPGAMNPGAIGSDGRLRIQPIITAQRPDFVQEIIEAERKGINDSLYVSLFQILVNNPEMTATEAMIRNNEKGELLGPAGGKIQQAMAQDVERIGGILQRKRAMDAGSPLAPPASLGGKDFGARFTSPLDRLRRAQEGVGIQRSLEAVLPIAQFKSDVMDNIDTDEITRTIFEINGAPRNTLKRVEERDADRARNQQMQAAQMALEMAKTGGEAAKNIVPAVGQAQQIAQGQPAA